MTTPRASYVCYKSSRSTSIASGFAGKTRSDSNALAPSGPELAATNPVGARAAFSSAAMASILSSRDSPFASSAVCALRAMAWEAIKLTSVLQDIS